MASSEDIHDLESPLLQLDPQTRAGLAKTLLASLDDLADEEYDRLWAEEVEARYADFLAGRTNAVDGPEVFARAREASLKAYRYLEEAFRNTSVTLTTSHAPLRAGLSMKLKGQSTRFALPAHRCTPDAPSTKARSQRLQVQHLLCR